jgi:hypothetical protein
MRYLVLGLIAFAAMGCTRATQVYTPDGRQGLALTCSGTLNSWSSCFKAAGERCGERGYDLLARDASTGQYGAINYTSGVGLNGAMGTTHQREMMVACKR